MMTPGTMIAEKYRIRRLIGEGGMGAVYEAEHAFLGKRVAIKVIAPDFAHDAQAVQRFYREAQAAARIGHENILDVNDVGLAADGQPYLVMELLQGKSLASVIAESAPLPVGRVVDIATQTLEALHAAHDAGIVHRDMKPDNLFLTRVAGRVDFVKVLDFGISKVRGGAAGKTNLTQTGTVLGTPAYMSPEQARGETDVDGRVDVWAMGVILFEMLTGHVPFDGANYNQIMFAVVSAPIPRLRALREGITPEFEAVVMRALERDLGQRYPTALAFRDDLVGAWMSVGESGFAVRSAPTPYPALGDDATELAPAMMLAQAPRRIESAGASPVPNVSVAEPFPTVGTSSSASGAPTSPRGVAAAAKLAERGTVEVTPGATIALPSVATAPKSSKRRVPLVPALILAAAVIASGAFVVIRQMGSKDSGSSAGTVGTAAIPMSVPDAAVQVAAGDRPPLDAGVQVETSVAPPPPSSPLPSTPEAQDASAIEEKDVAAEAPAVVPPEPVESAKPPTEQRRDARQVPDAAPASVPPARPVGFVTVATNPTTQVYIDGDLVGRAPFVRREIPAGPHRILFVNADRGIHHEEPLVVQEGRTAEIRRSAEQLGARPVAAAPDAGSTPAQVDAGRATDAIRIRTGTYGRDAG